MEPIPPKEVVLRLVEMINGEVPRQWAVDCLDPTVTIHVDSAVFRGIENWQKWIHLIRNCGRVRELRLVPRQVSPDPQDPSVVELVVGWAGFRGHGQISTETSKTYRLRYRVEGRRIVEIWTRRANYEFIFGKWIISSVLFRLFLGWAVFYFAYLVLRGIDFRIDRAA